MGRLTIDNFMQQQINALCEYNVGCGTYEDVATCVSVVTVQFGRGNGFNDVIEAVHQNKVHFDPVAAQACLDSFATRSCDRDTGYGNRGLDESCLNAVTGTVAASGVCGLNAECVSQSCVKGNCPAGTCCQGTCSAGAAPGTRNLSESCTSRDICLNSYCVLTPNNMGICQPYKSDGTSCTLSDECAPGSTCRMVNGTTPSCAPLVAQDGICSTNADCKQLSNVCPNGTCTPGGLTAYPCGSTPGFAASCQDQHYCSSGKCALFPGHGEPCTFVPICRDGFCDNSVCAPYKDNGDPCAVANQGAECQSRFCNADGMCQMQQSCI